MRKNKGIHRIQEEFIGLFGSQFSGCKVYVIYEFFLDTVSKNSNTSYTKQSVIIAVKIFILQKRA